VQGLLVVAALLGCVVGGAALIYGVVVHTEGRRPVRAFWAVFGCAFIAIGLVGLVALVTGQTMFVQVHPLRTTAIGIILTVIVSSAVLASTGLVTRRDIADIRASLSRLRGPALRRQPEMGRTSEEERVATRIFRDLEREPIRGPAHTYHWETKGAAERGTMMGSGTSLKDRLSLFAPPLEWTPQAAEMSQEIEVWIQRYWHDRMQFWDTYASWDRVREAFERGPRLTPGTESSQWKRFWLGQIENALSWLEHHPPK
jgi:hypothetical protein